MSDKTTRLFEYQDEKSAKFWEVTTAGGTVTVRYGKIGTAGQSQTKELADAAAAAKHVAKLVAEKTGKGYVESGGAATVPASASAELPAPVVEAPATEPMAAASRKKSPSSRKPAPKNPAKDPEASPESLLPLLDQDDATNRLLARHPKASAEMLEKLSHSSDQATRKAVCLNPNADKDVLLRLAPQFPGDFFRNPVFDWLLLEDPDLLFKLGQGVLKNILKRPDCPLSFLQWAASHGSEQEQLAVAMNPNAPAELIGILANKSGSVADAAKGRFQPDTAAQVDLDQAFRDEVSKALVGMLEINEKYYDLAYDQKIIDLDKLFNATHKTFRKLKKINEKKLEKELSIIFLNLIDKDKEKLDVNLVGIFARSKARGLRLIGLTHSKADPEILAKRSKSTDWVERLAIARNPSTPTNVLTLLTQDTHALVARQAQKTEQIKAENQARQNATLAHNDVNVNLQPIVNEICNKFRTDSCWALQVAGTRWWGLVSVEQKIGYANLELFEDNREFLIQSPLKIDWMVNSQNTFARYAAASSPQVLPEHLEILANDKEWLVQHTVAQNPRTPISVLEKFSKDKNPWTREQVAKNPNIPLPLLEMLAKDNESMTRNGAAENTQAPLPLLELLAKDISNIVRGKVAANPMVSVPLIELLAKDKNSYVRMHVAGNSKTPTNILKTLANDKNFEVRSHVALNTATPLKQLDILARDKKELVRSMVAKNPNATASLLEELAKDEKYSVRISVLINDSTPFELIKKISTGQDNNVKNKDESFYSYRLIMEEILLRRKAQDPNTSEDQLIDLARIGLWSIRLAAINNPSLSASDRDNELSKLWEELEAAVCATDAPLPPEHVELHEIPAALKALGRMPDPTDKNAVAEAAKSDDLLKRVGAILTTGIQPSLLRMLLDDELETVRQLAANKLRELESAQ
jgi:predicted DNA-binding WGR domain protein